MPMVRVSNGGTALIPPNKGIVISNLNDMGTKSVDFSSGSLTITNSKAQMVSAVLNVKNWNKIKTNNDGLYSCKGFNTIDSMTSITVSYDSYTNISAYDYIAFYSTNNVITFTT